MNISRDGSVVMTEEELTSLVSGKFSVAQCWHCAGKGWYYVHETGIKRDPVHGEDIDDFYQHTCNDEDECMGLGYFVRFPSVYD